MPSSDDVIAVGARCAGSPTRSSRFVGTGDLPNFFRAPYGPGWALTGDAGYHKDPLTAQGISDAFRDAELLTGALDRWLAGDGGFEEEPANVQRIMAVTGSAAGGG